MIIVSQNKLCMVNFDNINTIYITDTYKIICDTNNNDGWCTLGEYNTEEECQNVFAQLITDINLNLHSNYCYIIYMPQSGDINED